MIRMMKISVHYLWQIINGYPLTSVIYLRCYQSSGSTIFVQGQILFLYLNLSLEGLFIKKTLFSLTFYQVSLVDSLFGELKFGVEFLCQRINRFFTLLLIRSTSSNINT